jgi:hypothetical protein
MSGKPRLTGPQMKAARDSILKSLQRTPIVESACQKVGISRMTFYRWKKNNQEFSQKVDEALEVSRGSINDLAESKMIEKISRGDNQMIKFWLVNNNPRYKRKFKEEILKQIQPVLWGVQRSPFMTGGFPKQQKK